MKKKFIGILTAVSGLLYTTVSMGMTAFATGEAATTAAGTAAQQQETGSVFWTLIFPADNHVCTALLHDYQTTEKT